MENPVQDVLSILPTACTILPFERHLSRGEGYPQILQESQDPNFF